MMVLFGGYDDVDIADDYDITNYHCDNCFVKFLPQSPCLSKLMA